eukprot:CAMPEP_0204576816 /NCGR_PEP_ID=MMETSP0661-20131031/41993_1 /ASSEMBLY_ACC=CAM_ASM_000606 /TAXON_ID=109239 /ORGANISM="Alexandrium margalefi, Strain AMGDE01CS-322" /LENGTH=149 /DNA_ID=CAMNT_0051585597 /DNA_START=85 /DNA_END=530 /DNA_ORIENTATION=+
MPQQHPPKPRVLLPRLLRLLLEVVVLLEEAVEDAHDPPKSTKHQQEGHELHRLVLAPPPPLSLVLRFDVGDDHRIDEEGYGDHADIKLVAPAGQELCGVCPPLQQQLDHEDAEDGDAAHVADVQQVSRVVPPAAVAHQHLGRLVVGGVA